MTDRYCVLSSIRPCLLSPLGRDSNTLLLTRCKRAVSETKQPSENTLRKKFKLEAWSTKVSFNIKKERSNIPFCICKNVPHHVVGIMYFPITLSNLQHPTSTEVCSRDTAFGCVNPRLWHPVGKLYSASTLVLSCSWDGAPSGVRFNSYHLLTTMCAKRVHQVQHPVHPAWTCLPCPPSYT
jgi:hypothetical protein